MPGSRRRSLRWLALAVLVGSVGRSRRSVVSRWTNHSPKKHGEQWTTNTGAFHDDQRLYTCIYVYIYLPTAHGHGVHHTFGTASRTRGPPHMLHSSAGTDQSGNRGTADFLRGKQVLQGLRWCRGFGFPCFGLESDDRRHVEALAFACVRRKGEGCSVLLIVFGRLSSGKASITKSTIVLSS